jgi:hypothetical protein
MGQVIETGGTLAGGAAFPRCATTGTTTADTAHIRTMHARAVRTRTERVDATTAETDRQAIGQSLIVLA